MDRREGEPTMPLFDASSGEELKDEGMARVQKREDYEAFACQVFSVVNSLCGKCDEFTVARVRFEFASLGISEPSHPNMWGPAMKKAVKAGLIQRTGRTVKSQYPDTAHARMVPVYRPAQQ